MRRSVLLLSSLVLCAAVGPLFADTWSPVSSMPEPKWELAATTGGDGLVYAIGGMNDSGPPSTANAFSYDPSSDTWSPVSPLPSGPRRNLAAATDFCGRIYAIGGYTPEFPLATVERYDPSVGYWTRLRDLPLPRQGLAAATGGDGRIYAIGGVPFSFNSTDRVDAYDPEAGVWSQVSSLGTPRSGFAAATGLDGRIYVMGGYGTDAYLSSAEVYDPWTDTWSPIASMLSIRFALAAATGPDGRIYAVGGYDGYGDVSSVEAYDPNTDTWTLVASMIYARSGHAATAGTDGKIYAIGGDGPLAVSEAYTADQITSDAKIPSAPNFKAIRLRKLIRPPETSVLLRQPTPFRTWLPTRRLPAGRPRFRWVLFNGVGRLMIWGVPADRGSILNTEAQQITQNVLAPGANNGSNRVSLD